MRSELAPETFGDSFETFRLRFRVRHFVETTLRLIEKNHDFIDICAVFLLETLDLRQARLDFIDTTGLGRQRTRVVRKLGRDVRQLGEYLRQSGPRVNERACIQASDLVQPLEQSLRLLQYTDIGWIVRRSVEH